ncbi:IS30 family transposase [Companilactobacillus keshanensis]|uniref:IS30 family transposase n=1 Tax=Companilactobacillus keshanensis TaxID=2486003 RepID=A0ABW4BSL0_9LACO|nr:IS30 family transposase [Companilactobacillus keshanensis]
MGHYYQITSFERARIEVLSNQHISIRSIASRLNRSPSTICRELSRCKKGCYQAEIAHKDHVTKHTNSHRSRILENDSLRNYVVDKILNHQWSPEQISNSLKRKFGFSIISYATIYRGIYLNNLGIKKKSKDARGLPRKLRHKGKTRHVAGSIERRGKISISNSIHERPELANKRSRIGDWELDTVLGITAGQVLVTVVDRCTRILIAKRAKSRKAKDVEPILIEILESLPKEQRKTLTPDRGKEFSSHVNITSKMEIEFYFPDPHSPWQRGSNENTNGLIREYIPKGYDISTLSDEYIEHVVSEINSRPRKIFNWQSASEVYLMKCCN